MYDILLVEDEPEILQLNMEMLMRRGGYNVRTATNLAEAAKAVMESEPDIIVLDIMLPDGSGIDFLIGLKKERDIPVLFLSGLGSLQDKLEGFKAGGDDYLPKPYDNSELQMRIEAILHRSNRVLKKLTRGPLMLDMISNSVLFNGNDLGIRKREFDVLYFLMQHEGKVLSAEEIYEQVWKKKMLGDNRTVKTAVYNLRNSLEGTGYTINSVYGKGYIFEQEL
ncbi:MAG: response regulator transcription factor [Defluviitaleaceae bacterium]|nr:response regulator transcription factor [Defluviitaleaceae bacterium]